MIKRINTPMWDQMQFFCKHIADHQIRFILHFDRLLDEKILKNAVKITAENNPIVFANYLEDNQKIMWQFNEIDVAKIYSFQKCQAPDKLMQEFVLKQINTFTGPQLIISLIRSETDIIILNCNHVISDAAGLKDFTYQLAENYNSISRNKINNKQNYKPSRSLKVLSKKLGIKEKISVFKLTLSQKKSAPTFQKNIEVNHLQNPDFKIYTIKPVDFIKIKEFSKKYLVTINDILLTVIYYTLKKLLKNSNKTNRLTYTSDLRIYLDNEDYDVLSNFSAIHNIDINNSINDFISLLKDISTITKTRKQMKYGLADFPTMATLFKVIPYQKLKSIFHNEFDKIKEGKSNASPSLTNMGVIDETKLDFYTISPTRAYLLGGVNHPALFQIAVSTYKKHLTISIGSYFTETNSTFISYFMEELKKTIKEGVL